MIENAYKRFVNYLAMRGYPAIMFIFAYTGIQAEVFTILGVLVVLDVITGIMKTIALGDKPRSSRMSSGLLSKLALLLIPVVVGLTLRVAIGTDLHSFVNKFTVLLVLAEGYSVIQNLVVTTIRKPMEEYDAITFVFTTMQKFMRDYIEKWLNSGKGDGFGPSEKGK